MPDQQNTPTDSTTSAPTDAAAATESTSSVPTVGPDLSQVAATDETTAPTAVTPGPVGGVEAAGDQPAATDAPTDSATTQAAEGSDPFAQPTDSAPSQDSLALTASDAASPEAAASEQAPATSSSTSTGVDSGSDVTSPSLGTPEELPSGSLGGGLEEAPAADPLAPAAGDSAPTISQDGSVESATAAPSEAGAASATDAPIAQTGTSGSDKPTDSSPSASSSSSIFTPPMIESTGEYPQPQDKPVAVHPQTMKPLLNDGVGDDAGKVGKQDDNTAEDEGSLQHGYAPFYNNVGDNEGGAPSGGDVNGQDVVQKMEDFFGALVSKLDHVEHMIHKLLHRHH